MPNFDDKAYCIVNIDTESFNFLISNFNKLKDNIIKKIII